jgi:hypothetical protein
VLAGDRAEIELEQLRVEVSRRAKVGKRLLSQAVKAALGEQVARQRAEAREHQAAHDGAQRSRTIATQPPVSRIGSSAARLDPNTSQCTL